MSHTTPLPSTPRIMAVPGDQPGTDTRKFRFPLHLQVLAGFAAGGLLGVLSGPDGILRDVTSALGDLGMLAIRLLKTFSVPLVFLAVVHAILKTSISGRQAKRLLKICAINATAALLLGLLLMNTLQPGRSMQHRIAELAAQRGTEATTHGPANPAAPTLNPLINLAGFLPESVLQPFSTNNIISVVLMALLAGFALRRAKEAPEQAVGIQTIEAVIGTLYDGLIQMLSWIVRAVPFAVMGLVAQAVGRSGFGIFTSLWAFVLVLTGGLMFHGAIYYPLAGWLFAGKSPRDFFSQGADALLMGISTNSSLATVPTTLRCLTENMGVSESSARLSACVGTNLNNDGITLYEAMAAIFLAQACGMNPGLGAQLTIVGAAIMAGIGVAGIPEAGLIVLPLVLSAAGLPDWLVATAIPLILPVDWLISRARSGVNVLSDMLVALLLDGKNPTSIPKP